MVPVSRYLGFRSDLLPRLPEHMERATSYTYAVYDGEAIKIGKSRGHPKRRMDALQTGNPRCLHLLAYSAVLSEATVHAALSRWRLRGEWFAPSNEVLRYIGAWCWVDAALLVELLDSGRIKS